MAAYILVCESKKLSKMTNEGGCWVIIYHFTGDQHVILLSAKNRYHIDRGLTQGMTFKPGQVLSADISKP